MNNEPPADLLEFWVRFVCGAVFCAGAAGFAMLSQRDSGGDGSWVLLAVSGVIGGLLAAWLGDRFWFWLKGL